MKKLLIPILSLWLVIFVYVACTAFKSPEKEKIIIELLRYVLKQFHYEPTEIDNDLSKKLYKSYIETLDGQKHFFIQSDIEEFGAYELRLDEEVKYESLRFFDITYERLQKRLSQVKEMFPQILSKNFDLTKDETWNIDQEFDTYATDLNALKERWRKSVKYKIMRDVLGEFGDKKISDSLLLVSDSTQIRAREEYLKDLEGWYGRLLRKPRKYWFGKYLDALATTFDPHTNYLPPIEKKQFDINMSGQLEGIGARLTQRLGVIHINSLVPGGPAWRQGEITAGDKILKVGQGEEGTMVNIVNMDMDDVLERIRGKKGTLVRLEIKKSDGQIKTIPIVRDVIELEEVFARSAVVTYQKSRYGYISLPKFYINFQDKDQRDCAKDVRREIEKLKNSGVKGIVLDLRFNGGGSLKSCVEIAGMFIDQGPVVQVRGRDENIQTLYDEDGGEVLYDGPLVILVSKLSASASEILAAVLQDYERAVILGGDHTFGKGTVQGLLDLDPMLFQQYEEFRPLGTVKLTRQKFYRVTGKTTQLKGVSSDVVLPDAYMYAEVGEKEEKNALSWDTIPALRNYKIWNPSVVKKVIKKSNNRIKNSDYFKTVQRRSQWVKKNKNDSLVHLNIRKYKKSQEAYLENLDKFDLDGTWEKEFKASMTVADEKATRRDSVLLDRYQGWLKEIEKDAYIQESLEVLQDFLVAKQ